MICLRPAFYLLALSFVTVLPPRGFAEETPTNELVKGLIEEDLGVRKFSFGEVVNAASDKQVIPFDPDNPNHQFIAKKLHSALDDALIHMSRPDAPVRDLRRINEASRFFEDYLLKALNEVPELSCAVPANRQGKEQRSGYPDLLITHAASGTIFYLDPKLYEEKSRQSSLRTFYFEPRERTLKINHNAVHLLVGIAHDGNDGAWTFTRWEVVDLSHLQVRLKAEFQASNRDLYRPAAIVGASE